MSYKPQSVTPCRFVIQIDPTDPGSIMAGAGSWTVQTILEWDSQEGKQRPEDGELCVETRRVRNRPELPVRLARAEILRTLANQFTRMANMQTDLHWIDEAKQSLNEEDG